MEDFPDLRKLMASRTQQLAQFPGPFSRPYNNYQPNLGHHQEVNTTRGFFEFASSSAPPGFRTIDNGNVIFGVANLNGENAGSMFGLELMNHHGHHHHHHGWMSGMNGSDGSGGNNSRWPRQETLTLLEIRSSLDFRFKETNQKGPLWDEVSSALHLKKTHPLLTERPRIMSEEHGYQRSGKKCKEKFENLYKYYKKTKEGKAGRQDGKHYRFFRQLEAIYGDRNPVNIPLWSTSDQTNILTSSLNPSIRYHHTTNSAINQEYQQVNESLSFSNNSTEMETSTSNNGDDLSNSANENDPRREKKKTWKAQVEEFVSLQMVKVMKAKENWMEKIFKTIEGREEERISREEERRKLEAERFSQQVHEFWAKERAWVETRDASIMEAISQVRGVGASNNKSILRSKKDEKMGLLPSSSDYMNIDFASSLYIAANEAENVWSRYGGKLSK